MPFLLSTFSILLSRGATLRAWLAPLAIALIAFLTVAAALDPAGDFPHSFQGPGLTVDEIFNVDQGKKQVDRLLAGDLPGYRQAVAELPDHPPLGRIWLGLWHELMFLVSPPAAGHTGWVVANARMAAAGAFALLIFLTGWTTARWYCPRVGLWTSLAILLMPRLFGHAHLAVLELPITLTYTLTLLALATLWTGPNPPGLKPALLAGLVFGLALLTKIQGILLPIPVSIWALLQWRHRALKPLLIWGLTGGLLFFLGWTWLWEDPLGHLKGYLTHTTERAHILVTYFGQKLEDTHVPWHYPWVIFFTTLPLGWILLGGIGLTQLRAQGKCDPRLLLILGGMLFPLVLFTIPNIAVYDGERLFLMCYPLWAIFVGLGTEAAVNWLAARFHHNQRPAAILLLCFCLAQSVGIFQMAPCYLSYYNLLTGSLPGAAHFGLPVTYWGDGVTRELINKSAQVIPPRGELALAPVLHPNHTVALFSQSPALRAKEINVIPYVEKNGSRPQFVLMFPRLEYLPDGWSNGPPGYRPIQEVRRAGILLGGLYERSPDSPPP